MGETKNLPLPLREGVGEGATLYWQRPLPQPLPQGEGEMPGCLQAPASDSTALS
jgi:hypothetical protein